MGSIGHSQELFDKGWDCFTSGDYMSAIAYFGKVIDEDPNHVLAYNNRAAANVKIGNYAQGITDFERSLAIDPNNEFARTNMNMLLKADHIDSNFDKGVSCIDSGNYQLAIAYFDEVVKDAPHNVGAYANRSTALIGLGDYWEALRDLERAITIDPGDPQLRRNRGILLKDYPTPPVDLFDIPDRTDFGPLNRYPLETFNKEGVSSVDLGEHSKRGMGLPKLMDVPLDKPESD